MSPAQSSPQLLQLDAAKVLITENGMLVVGADVQAAPKQYRLTQMRETLPSAGSRHSKMIFEGYKTWLKLHF